MSKHGSFEENDPGDHGGTAVLERPLEDPELIVLYFQFQDRMSAAGFGRLLVTLSDLYEVVTRNLSFRTVTDADIRLRIDSVQTGDSITVALVAIASLKLASWLQERWKQHEEIRNLQAERHELESRRLEQQAAADRYNADLPRVRDEEELSRRRLEALEARSAVAVELDRERIEFVRARAEHERAKAEKLRIENGLAAAQMDVERLRSERIATDETLLAVEAREPETEFDQILDRMEATELADIAIDLARDEGVTKIKVESEGVDLVA